MLILRKKTEDCLQKDYRLVYFIAVDPYEIRKEMRKEIPNREYHCTARPEKKIADLGTEPCFPAYLSARCTGSGSECGRRLLLQAEPGRHLYAARASCYWYVTADHNSVAAQADGLRLEGVRYPVNIRTGSGMTLTGTANSATGTTLTSVQVAILDAADQTVQSAAAQANAAAFSLNTLDSQIRFGELPEGSYSYMVLVTDSTGESLCFASDFTVSGSASSTQTYWSVKDAEGTKLQQTVQQMETTVETAAETTVSWFAKLFD